MSGRQLLKEAVSEETNEEDEEADLFLGNSLCGIVHPVTVFEDLSEGFPDVVDHL